MAKHKPLERNPVILSLLILKAMGIEEEQHGKFREEWQPLWNALVAYRDSMKHEKWTSAIMDDILSGDPKAGKGELWDNLNAVFNRIWEKANS